jgi:Domain of unknown function DUF29
MSRDLYEDDIALWAERQADVLRRRASNEIDWENVAEEIEDVARRERNQIRRRLVVLCVHLLKWQFQPKRRTRSWRGFIVEARARIAGLVEDGPSLRPYPAKALGRAYSDGRPEAEAETGLTKLPAECPWTIDQVLDADFWPEAR